MWLVLLLVLAVLIFVVVKKSSKKNGKKKNNTVCKRNSRSRKNSKGATKAEANQYHAISICCEKHACDTAIASQGRRYLVVEAPPLPLPDCNAENCHCHYEHHDDRRDNDGDRRFSFGLSQDLHSGTDQERRKSRDRRKKQI